VFDLCPNKEQVLSEAFKVLKEGGEIYFSDVYADRRMPDEHKNNDILWGECLSGALYYNDFFLICQKVGFNDPRLVKYNKINIMNSEIEKLIGHINFFSAT
jgi:SAM-dependent methyltransferase